MSVCIFTEIKIHTSKCEKNKILFGTFNFSTMIIIFQDDYVNYVNFIYIDIRLTLRFVCSVIFMSAAAAKWALLFVVLCSNKEQQKHCVVRELNLNACKLFHWIFPPYFIYINYELIIIPNKKYFNILYVILYYLTINISFV